MKLRNRLYGSIIADLGWLVLLNLDYGYYERALSVATGADGYRGI